MTRPTITSPVTTTTAHTAADGVRRYDMDPQPPRNVPTWRARITHPRTMGVSERFANLAKDTTGSVAL